MNAIEFRDQVMEWMRLTSEAMNGIFTPLTEPYGLTPLQAHALCRVRDEGYAKVGSLMKLGMTSGNASSLCKKLERLGFLERVRDAQDGRQVRLVLTGHGQTVLRDLDAQLLARYSRVLEGQGRGELEALLLSLRQFYDLLAEMKEQDHP